MKDLRSIHLNDAHDNDDDDNDDDDNDDANNDDDDNDDDHQAKAKHESPSSSRAISINWPARSDSTTAETRLLDLPTIAVIIVVITTVVIVIVIVVVVVRPKNNFFIVKLSILTHNVKQNRACEK